MKIIITGGAGFMGSHLCSFLLERGHEVVCIDNFYTSTRENVKHLLGNRNFRLVEHDITKPLNIHADQIYNLACPASPVHYQRNPVETIRVCTIGVMNMLELARCSKARILQASTSEVYGNPEQHPQSEDYNGNVNCISVRSCYDEGKRLAESLVIAYMKQYNVDVRIVRIFNTYGERMAVDDGRVVSNFIVQALKGEDITVYGNGKQTRSFCCVADMVEGLYKAMNSDYSMPINLGNPEEWQVIELAKKIKELTKSNSKIVFRELPQDDPVKRRPDINLAKKILGWEPKVGIDEGLRMAIRYFKSVIG